MHLFFFFFFFWRGLGSTLYSYVHALQIESMATFSLSKTGIQIGFAEQHYISTFHKVSFAPCCLCSLTNNLCMYMYKRF